MLLAKRQRKVALSTIWPLRHLSAVTNAPIDRVLQKVNNSMYYDKGDKQYRTWPSFITTKYGTYV